MTDGPDPLERLRAANPIPADQVANLADPRWTQALYQRIVSTPQPRSRRTRRPRRIALLAAAALAPAAAAGAYALANREVSKPLTVGCYESADLKAKTIVIPAQARGAVRACADIWASGVFGPRQPPPLAACVLPTGVLAVFPTGPGRTPCEALRLPELPSDRPSPAATDFIAFKDAVVEEIGSQKCADPDVARETVRRELGAWGMANWKIAIGGGVKGEGFSAERPCAGLAFREEAKVVTLVPQPRRP